MVVVVGRIFWSNFDFFQSCLEAVLKLFGHCFWTQFSVPPPPQVLGLSMGREEMAGAEVYSLTLL